MGIQYSEVLVRGDLEKHQFIALKAWAGLARKRGG